MVELDQSEVELQWECPPCVALRLPALDLEPPQQTVAKLPRPRLTPADSVIPIPAPAPPPDKMQRSGRPSYAASNGVGKHNGQVGGTNGVNSVPGRLSFPDVRIRDLPFYPVKATLLRPSSLVLKTKDSQVRIIPGLDIIFYCSGISGATESELGFLFNSRTSKHSQQWESCPK